MMASYKREIDFAVWRRIGDSRSDHSSEAYARDIFCYNDRL